MFLTEFKKSKTSKEYVRILERIRMLADGQIRFEYATRRPVNPQRKISGLKYIRIRLDETLVTINKYLFESVGWTAAFIVLV